ncbi:MAG: T9SS type A sorting domain-containing protein [Ignavibacteriaceae bacterium]
MVTGINEESVKLLSFKLEQNYPNPFNPTTSIKYSIASRQFVELKIFNVLGQEIQTLINEEKSAGSYQIEFNAADLSSGVYFYRIHAGSFNQVRKMLLIK